MSSKEPVQRSLLTGSVDSFLNQKKKEKSESDGKSEGDVEFLTIIEFVDRFKLLPYGLFPTQKFILKLYYNLPLDGIEKTIKVTDKFNREVLYELTEKEYLEYLYDNGRCNIRFQDGKIRNELILVAGRRAGKSEISSIVCAYEVYKLICRGNPQEYYGMPSSSEIRILDIANDKDQASIVYGNMQGYVGSVDYFKSSCTHDTQSYMKFRTDGDRKKYGSEGRSSLVASFKSSIAKGLRGRGVICAVLDEIAFFIDNGKSSAEKVYRAINPSLAQFSPKDPNNKHVPVGETHGRMILISSPDSKEGFFYHQYLKAMSNDPGSSNMLVIQAPTWEVNPTIDPTYYEREFFKDPTSFRTEHGAEFSDRVRGWIEDSVDLQLVIDPKLRPKQRGLPREVHFAGVDFGISNDGTSISLTKFNGGKIELVYHEVWYPKVRWKESNPHLTDPINPYALLIHEINRLDIDQISEWFLSLSKLFYIHKGVFDQWAGPIFEQILHKKGLEQFEMRNFHTADSSYMYQNFKMMMFNKRLSLYDWPIPDPSENGGTRHSPIIQELLELQATSAGKNMVAVEAPKVRGKHDDMSDSLARSVLLASEYLKENPGALDINYISGASPFAPRIASYSHGQYQRMKARMHGVVKERTPNFRTRVR